MATWSVPGYSEVRLLGEGAQGRVVLARHDDSGAPAAIKYLSESLREDARFRERFRGEADLLRRLRTPYIAQMWGLVEAPEGAAIVMEAVDGVSLEEVLARQGALTAEASLTVLKGSLLGLAAAHDVSVVHRDYKPANVIVRADGSSKLIDFGIAVDAGETGRSGTPAYMAPEQWRDEPASPATDVYAATCVFFECVTGRRPFTAGSWPELRDLHLGGEIPAGEAPGPLRPLITRGLAKDPWGRPEGATAFVTELETAASAAYGPDWEQRGVRALAGAAAALAMLFPLAAAGIAPAGGGAAGAGGTAAGAAGTGAATGGKGIAGVLGVKGATAIAGTLVVAGVAGGVGYVVTRGDGAESRPAPPPTAPATPLSFALQALPATPRTLPGGATWRAQGQVVTVAGHRDPAIGRRINQALQAPLDARFARSREILGNVPNAAFTTTVRTTIQLRGPRLLSVLYATDVLGPVGTGWNQSVTATVDLENGTAYRSADLFRPEVQRAPRPLDRRVRAHLPGRAYCPADTVNTGSITAARLRGDAVAVSLTRASLHVFVDTVALGYAGACGSVTARIPYAEAHDLLRPEILAAIPYKPPASPAPTRS
ncbi:serine/threonine-protein kinase [Spirillospora sp. NPDC047279]|uniref:serine/threonine-protein kinase n=1 Tax=Spirillospora sp. NPDC047279 TaxID=3155478 RepID=UPI0033F16B5E